MAKWRLALDINITKLFDDLISALPYQEMEFEINPMAERIKINSKEIKALFDLQIKELSSINQTKIKGSKFVTSESRSIDKKNLTKAFISLET